MKKAEAFFWRGAAALERLHAELRECYVCPICTSLLFHESLETKLLTLEHAPSKAVGGKAVTLTCRKCNVESGSAIEGEVRKVEDAREFLRGKTTKTLRARLTVVGLDRHLNITVRREGNNITVLGLPKNNPPDLQRSWEESLEKAHEDGSWGDYHFQVLLPGVNLGRARIGDLKAAYLIAFAALGYKYILRATLDRVRRQILEPERPILTNFHGTRRQADPAERHLVITEQPVRSLYVQMGRKVVFFPTPEDDETFYDDLPDRIAAGVNFSGQELAWPLEMEMALDFVEGPRPSQVRRPPQGQTVPS